MDTRGAAGPTSRGDLDAPADDTDADLDAPADDTDAGLDAPAEDLDAEGTFVPAPVTAEQPVVGGSDEPDDLAALADAPALAATIHHPHPDTDAFSWVDPARVARPHADDRLDSALTPYTPVGEPDLLRDAPHRSPARPGVIIPILVAGGLAATYAATTLLWPLNALPPQVEALTVDPVPSAETALVWPERGAAGVSIAGIPGNATSSVDAAAMASITKVVTALAVLDELPLAPGEQGPSYSFTYSDNLDYWAYRARGESALDVPVGGSLTEYEMLEGILIGSANNYAQRLASTLWPTNAVYASAANRWLSDRGITGVTVVEPTGIDAANRGTPEGLLQLARVALANPVIAEIVAKQRTTLPGAGEIENTNELVGEDGILGIKTGTLIDPDRYSLLSAKEITVDEVPVRLYASVTGQGSDEARNDLTRALYEQLEVELQTEPSVPVDTVAGEVTTAWGEPVDVLTAADAEVILWNGDAASASIAFDLADQRAAGEAIGTLSVAGPLNATSVDLVLADDIAEPDAWWRLTHPLELFGLTDWPS